MKMIWLLGLIFGCTAFAQGQKEKAELYDMLVTADSVQIASHKDLLWVEETPPYGSGWHKLIVDNKVNDTIIKERANLNNVAVKELFDVLAFASPDEELYQPYCFNPHHVIFIYKGNDLFYLDICLQCYGAAASSPVKDILITNKSYKAVAGFFRKHKILYKLPEEGKYGY
jgi:hypothetical protein